MDSILPGQHIFPTTQSCKLCNIIFEEYGRTENCLLKLSGNNELMHDYPVERLPIQMPERIGMPLTTIPQYALTKLRDEKSIGMDEKAILERLIVRRSFGIINAGRNSV